jgi:hypothetical protein
MASAKAYLAPFVYNRIEDYKQQFKAIFLAREPEKYFQEWMKHERDAFVYATVCCLGYIPANGDEVICAQSSANCIHTILTTPTSGVMHVKMVPYENTLDDIRVDAVVGKMISIIMAHKPDFQPYKENFLQYFCSANMYVKPNDLRIPYKKLFKTDERCGSILFDNINPLPSTEQASEFSGKEGFFKAYIYTKCIVNKAIHGHNLGFYIKNASDAWFIEFLKGDKLWKMCKGMYELGTAWGFVHNDAHTGNVIIDDASGEFVLIDYGRSYIKMDYDAENIILKQENVKHELPEPAKLFGNFPYIKPDDKVVVTKDNLADSLPVMCDIACLSYNIWKRVCAMNITGELGTVVEAIKKKILTFEGQTINYNTTIPDDALSNLSSSPNMRVIAAGLLWMRCYITEALKHVGLMKTGKLETTDIEGTVHAPDKILWNAGQINPGVYNAIKGTLNAVLTTNKMKELIDNAFGGGPGQRGGGPEKGPVVEERQLTDFELVRQAQEGPKAQTTALPSEPAKVAEVAEVGPESPTDKKFTFADITPPLINTFKEYTALDKAQMLKNYTGYYQQSTAFAQECMDKMARERGNFC